MIKRILLSLILVVLLSGLKAEMFYGSKANQILQGAQIIRYNNENSTYSYIRFYNDHKIAEETLSRWLSKNGLLSEKIELIALSEATDRTGDKITHYEVFINGYKAEFVRLVTQSTDGYIYAISGKIPSSVVCNTNITMSENSALLLGLTEVGASIYKWELPEEEKFLKRETGSDNASFFPKGELVLVQETSSQMTLCWKFNIYAEKPLSRTEVYVDAETGNILKKIDLLHFADVQGVAETKYSGTQNIVTDDFSGSFRLREAGRGNGIETYNMQMGTSYGNAIDFTDDDNYWNNVNPEMDEVATDAHWSTEMTYDYFYSIHGRNSIDGNGFALLSYVHFNLVDYGYPNNTNAFWDGQRMTYGDGDDPYTPLTTVDICGHEITHGLTSFSANLDYQSESGALNEAFSDIFGTAIEFYAKPATANWEIGEDMGASIRSLSDPNSYGKPDTYHGNYWEFSSADNGGVHTNSGVLGHWFYLLSEGGSGTNDNGDLYNITPIGMANAADVAFRTLTVYLANDANYADARFFAIQSAIDLFGECSPEVATVTDAFYAVGVGNSYVPYTLADFSSAITEFCAPPALVSFTNESINGTSFTWDFGDGVTSTEISPDHNYSAFGSFTVSLIADGGACGIDTIEIADYINVDAANPCIVQMPVSGTSSIDECIGTLYDNGGTDVYSNNINSVFTIQPLGATSIVMEFTEFSFESGYDYLYIYDGPDVSSTLIGQYSGDQLPEGGTVIAASGAMTLRQSTDPGVVDNGFVATWNCVYPDSPPIADFSCSATFTCTGNVSFIDASYNGPQSWSWDFGDGFVSTEQNPLHIYTQNGIYTVTMIASNSFGSDTIVYNNLVTVNLPALPLTTGAVGCENESVQLLATGSGTMEWYDQVAGGALLDTGSVFNTPQLSQSTPFYVQSAQYNDTLFTGKPDNSGGGGYFGNVDYIHYLVFDCYTPTKLISVNVYATGAAYRHIALRNNSGAIIQEGYFYVEDGEHRVMLDFDIPVGSDLQLVGLEAPDLYRNNSGVAFPYEIAGLISVKYSSASANPLDYYYYFYDWEVSEQPCTSQRVEVLAEVNTISLNLPDYIHTLSPDTVVLDAGSGFDSYLWNSGAVSQVYSVAEYGVYSVTVSLDGCTETDSVSVTFLESLSKPDFSELVLYPNPGKGIFYLDLKNSDIATLSVKIYTITGQLVKFVMNIEDRLVTLDLSDLPDGFYKLSVEDRHILPYNRILVLQR